MPELQANKLKIPQASQNLKYFVVQYYVSKEKGVGS